MPHIIHCCWLGPEPKGALARACRASWEHFAPGWEVREWDLAAVRRLCAQPPPFFETALRRGKWAFAADWVRFCVLHAEGGVYFDYDFELVAPIDDLAQKGPFVAGQWLPDGTIAPEPAVIGLAAGSPIARAMLDYYAHAPFDGHTTAGEALVLCKAVPTVLPPEVFSPIDVCGVCHRTAQTRGIHHYAMKWASPRRRLARWLSWHGFHFVVTALLKVRRMLRTDSR